MTLEIQTNASKTQRTSEKVDKGQKNMGKETVEEDAAQSESGSQIPLEKLDNNWSISSMSSEWLDECTSKEMVSVWSPVFSRVNFDAAEMYMRIL